MWQTHILMHTHPHTHAHQYARSQINVHCTIVHAHLSIVFELLWRHQKLGQKSCPSFFYHCLGRWQIVKPNGQSSSVRICDLPYSREQDTNYISLQFQRYTCGNTPSHPFRCHQAFAGTYYILVVTKRYWPSASTSWILDKWRVCQKLF